MGTGRFGLGFVEYVNGDSLRLQRLAYMLTGTREDASDLVQDTLLQVGRAWGRIDSRGPHGYATTVMSRAACRTRKTVRASVDQARNTTEDGVSQVDERDRLRDAMRLLGPRQRAVIALRFYCDLPDKDIAGILNCSVSNVKSQASRGLSRLRESLDALGKVDATSQPVTSLQATTESDYGDG